MGKAQRRKLKANLAPTSALDRVGGEMASSQSIALLAATGVVTAVALVVAAAQDNHALSITAAALFAITCAWIAVRLNATGGQEAQSGTRRIGLAATNAGLLAAVFLWGGSAILAGYYLTELAWHHAWQYGGAMCLIAVALWVYRRQLARPGTNVSTPPMLRRAAALAGLQAIAAAGGLLFLLASGKLTAGKPDWLANHVFVAGGLLVILLSALAARAQLKQ